MGGPRKQPFSVAQWAALNEAFARAKAALSSSNLAEHDLPEHIRAGRLPSALRRIARDGSATFEPLKPSFWKGLQLLETRETGPDGVAKRSGQVRVRGIDAGLIADAELWFFVARSHLDKLYPVSVGRADDDEPPTNGKPGPRPKKNWKQHVVVELARRIEANEPVPTAPDIAQFCIDTLGFEPGLRQIQRLIKAIR